jgi:hypothetical protein
MEAEEPRGRAVGETLGSENEERLNNLEMVFGLYFVSSGEIS